MELQPLLESITISGVCLNLLLFICWNSTSSKVTAPKFQTYVVSIYIYIYIYILTKLPSVSLRPSHSLTPERRFGGKNDKYNKRIPLGKKTREIVNFTLVHMDSSPSVPPPPPKEAWRRWWQWVHICSNRDNERLQERRACGSTNRLLS
jgi:hypothetical protein